mmetsp:Transcript_61246/g.121215  ORF Transcript_61246/g.121215 Transcript_61246/m.121215 type:complete len:236 (-) Transcript_61246:495-1202(-)
MATTPGAFTSDDVQKLTQNLLLAGAKRTAPGKKAPPPPAKKEDFDSPSDKVFLFNRLRDTLQTVLDTPCPAGEGEANNEDIWRAAKQALTSERQLSDSVNEAGPSLTEVGLMSAVMACKELPNSTALREWLGEGPARTVQTITATMLKQALLVEDMMRVVNVVRLARRLPVAAELLAQTESYIKEHAEKAAECEDALARNARGSPLKLHRPTPVPASPQTNKVSKAPVKPKVLRR